MAFLEALPLLAEAGGEAGAGAAAAGEAGAGAAEAGSEGGLFSGIKSAASGLRTGISGAVNDFNDTPVGKFLGSSQGRMVTQGAQLAHQFNQRAQQQEQQTQSQEQGPQFA